MAKKKVQIQGAQIPRSTVALHLTVLTRDAAQRRNWTFYEAINCNPLENMRLLSGNIFRKHHQKTDRIMPGNSLSSAVQNP